MSCVFTRLHRERLGLRVLPLFPSTSSGSIHQGCRWKWAHDHSHQVSIPFSCDISNNDFFAKGDDEIADRGTKYERGHLDMVTLNHEMIKELMADEFMMQDYQGTREKVLRNIGNGLSVENLALAKWRVDTYVNDLRQKMEQELWRAMPQHHPQLIAR